MLMFYILVLRFVHIVASVCWAGAAFAYFLFVEPTAKALAPEGMKFIQYMVAKRRYSMYMGIVSTLTVLSGALLLWKDASGRWIDWLQTGPGLGFTLGSIVGIVVYFIGMLGIKPRGDRLGKLGEEVQAAGGPPTPAQMAELQKLDREMSALSRVDFILVAISLLFMATARFWLF